MMYRKCPTCGGSGKVNNRACPRCEGTGKMRGPLTSVEVIQTRMGRKGFFAKVLPMPPKLGPPLPGVFNIRWHKGG